MADIADRSLTHLTLNIMCANGYQYLWRCAKCSNHLCNIIKMDGLVKMEKKCPKCKSINIVTFVNGEISIKCRAYFENKEGFLVGTEEDLY